jgi:hypothetical protein
MKVISYNLTSTLPKYSFPQQSLSTVLEQGGSLGEWFLLKENSAPQNYISTELRESWAGGRTGDGQHQ